MPGRKNKKLLSDKELSKIREIDAYDHADKKRSNNPPIGIAKFDKTAEEITHYAYDPHIDSFVTMGWQKRGYVF